MKGIVITCRAKPLTLSHLHYINTVFVDEICSVQKSIEEPLN